MTAPSATTHILIVDDSESDTMLVEEAIKDTAIPNTVHVVNNTDDGFKYLDKQAPYENAIRPGLVLLDLKMPQMDGYEFLKAVKEDPVLASIPVIILTSSTDNKDIEDCYRHHANCYIVKPVNFMKFKKTISVICDFWLGVASLPTGND